jgi:hypothetical protein
MTEQEWHNASEPHAMLEFLRRSGRSSARKLRLFAVACSRRLGAWIDPLGRHAVDVAENFADGLAGAEEMRAARLLCQGAGGGAAWYAAATRPAIAARNAARSAQVGFANGAPIGSEADELLAQANLLREIFGERFQHVVAAPTPGIVKLAREIYDNRVFERMPLLANELEKAECANVEILEHCRGRGPHVRGCWALDILLGRDS